MSSDVILSVRNISKRYEIYDKPVKRLWQMLCAGHRNFFKEFWALRDISFEIRKGESIGIIGRNGAGKSTLLKIITGTLRQTTGSVWAKPGLRIAALLELGSGFNPEFTGRENVYLNASILGLSRKETEARYQEIIDFADIGDFINQPVKKYSSGMKMRLAFAVQIMVDPDILIVDEALSVGDMFFKQKCLHYLRKLKDRGTTLFFVSHSLETVQALCQRAVYLQKGRQVAVGDAKEVCEMYWNAGNRTSPAENGGGLAKVVKPLADLTAYFEDSTLDRRLSERTGSGEIKVVGIRVLNSEGREAPSAACGENLTIAVSIRAFAAVPAGAVFAFSFNLPTFMAFLSRFSLQHGLALPEMAVGERCVLRVNFNMPFRRGNWFLNFSLRADQLQNEYYDHIFNGAAISVLSEDIAPELRDWSYVNFDKISMTLAKE